jgi:hypothetical protein
MMKRKPKVFFSKLSYKKKTPKGVLLFYKKVKNNLRVYKFKIFIVIFIVIFKIFINNSLRKILKNKY